MTNTLKVLLARTPEGRIIARQLQRKQPELLGAFLPGLKKIGKYTRKITGGIAKVAAGMVGIPPSAIDALAKADPSAKKSLVSSLTKGNIGKKAAAVVNSAMQTAKKDAEKTESALSKINPLYYAGGAAALIAVFVIVKKKKRK
jgi:hypothetical protein